MKFLLMKLGIAGRRKALTAILSTFEKALDELNDFIASNNAEVQENVEAITTLSDANANLRIENARAQKVLTNIATLLDQDEEATEEK